MADTKCRSCGCDIARDIEVERDGVHILTGRLCFSCFDHATEGLEKLRAVFEMMIQANVSRTDANDAMCRIVELIAVARTS